MTAFLKRIYERLKALRKASPESFSAQTLLQALRQLNQRYRRQKRLWVYIILSAMALMVIYIMFSIFWAGLRAHAIPIAWIILAGIIISVFQVRRCNDLILSLRQAYQVQSQIEKVQAERQAREARKAETGRGGAPAGGNGHGPASSNGSQNPSDLPGINP